MKHKFATPGIIIVRVLTSLVDYCKHASSTLQTDISNSKHAITEFQLIGRTYQQSVGIFGGLL